jgi:preprotein translocase subunit SecA
MAGLYHFAARDATGHKRYDREKLIAWARDRLGAELTMDDVRNRPIKEIRSLLLEHSRRNHERANAALERVRERMDRLFGDPETAPGNGPPRENGELKSMADWFEKDFHCEIDAKELATLDRDKMWQRLSMAVEFHHRPEIRKMERSLVLQILDTAWKDHLLAMDHLRGSIGLRGYAQVDPKVEYKREGMRTFDAMWTSVGERVTDLIFRMEQLDEGFVGSTWTESEAIHEEAPPPSEIGDQQQAAIDGTQGDRKPEPIRNRGKKVGRNDPCPCGSGKKFKNCCKRKGMPV